MLVLLQTTKPVTPAQSNLLVGCSFSDYCGFGEIIGNHQDPRCWYNVVSAETGTTFTNLSYGGLSNREILHRASQAVLTAQYNVVIIQTTSVKRQWFWRNDSDEFCIFNGGRVSNTKTNLETNSLMEVGINFFNTQREVERDLVSLIMLQNYCKQQKSKLVLINAMGFLTMAEHAFPELFNQIDQTQFLHNSSTWKSQAIDFADDNLHPGEKSNKLYAEQVINHLKN